MNKNIELCDDDIVEKVLDYYITKGTISSAETVIFPRRGTSDTTWEELIYALVSTDDTVQVGIMLGYGISGFAKNPNAPKKGFESAQYKSNLNKILGKVGFKKWRTWFCDNILKIHYCQSCECYHPLEAFAHKLRGSKTQREVEYKHMCMETYNKDYQQDYVKDYHKRNPHLKREASARRRAKIKNCTIDVDLSAILKFYKECPKGCHVDHWMPLHLGGMHSLSNLVYLPEKENLSKSFLHPNDWIEKRKTLVAAGIL